MLIGNAALSRGTWYLGKKPMIAHAWGSKVDQKTTIPLWVKYENIPDSYWTREGLSFLGSAIGKPLSADDMTAKLEILPFAKLCVDYKIGEELPSKIEIEVLDPVLQTKHVEEVKVSYPNKPLVCNACKSLGHLVGACPRVTRHWVRRDNPEAEAEKSSEPSTDVPIANSPKDRPNVAESNKAVNQTEAEDVMQMEALNQCSKANPDPVIDPEVYSNEDCNKEEGNWKTVQSRKSKLVAAEQKSNGVKIGEVRVNTPIYNALTRSMPKRVKRPGGKPSPPL